ncbi:uncharacterized protein K460DRAFT_274148 [Cucurbitaria berberidis CBS 394.84]|uniref:Uncharacterized protein n=1 Tax=Cucurbitaria berberidis CBS 394.84 TaxID=1168544 RepID=A0A9P4GV46_9PLEO|nr:uncharacterized protein K460DRAFT_274148 [Cucurbitaria berberidis CBS 394.84]KAF1852104.1 hypothetical protein K460DRAFT_274148 [Cucurbitaria berberidis CBS 394.84]
MAIARLQTIVACMTCAEPKDTTYADEKLALLRDDDIRCAIDIADDVVNTMLRTATTGHALRMQLDSIVGVYGWKENIAKWVLEKLTLALQDAHETLGPAMRDAYHKAWDVARSIEGFVIEHPIMCTMIALGVLAILSPWVLEALGFAEAGPVADTFAAWWQSTYGGLVPKGSLFSFLQRLGMTWHLLCI